MNLCLNISNKFYTITYINLMSSKAQKIYHGSKRVGKRKTSGVARGERRGGDDGELNFGIGVLSNQRTASLKMRKKGSGYGVGKSGETREQERSEREV